MKKITKLSDRLTPYITEVNDLSKPNLNYTHHQIVFRFPNGYGASVIRSDHSYGGKNGLFELMPLKDDRFDADDPLGFLTPSDVESELIKLLERSVNG